MLEHGMLVDDALLAILGGRMRHWLDNEAATRDARDPEGLHQMRVALRRLRSAFSLLQARRWPSAAWTGAASCAGCSACWDLARRPSTFATEVMAPV
ncbi:MAG: CHAD domain-containing protein [Geminicoccaceae bacterium]